MDAETAVNVLVNGGSAQARSQAEHALASFQASNIVGYVQAMVQMACTGDAGATAQLATVALKNAFQHNATLQGWASMEASHREELKKMMLTVLWNTNPSTRSMMAEVIGIIGSYEFIFGVWSAFFEQIRDAIVADQPSPVKAAMIHAVGVAIQALSKEAEAQNLNLTSDLYPVTAVTHDLLLTEDPELAVAVLANVPAIFFSGAITAENEAKASILEAVMTQCCRPSSSVAVVDAALDLLDKIIDKIYGQLNAMATHLLGLAELRLQQTTDETDPLMLRLIDLWTTIAAWERVVVDYGGQFSAVIVTQHARLVTILHHALARNTIDDTWTVGKAAAVCLEECVLVARGNISTAILREMEATNAELAALVAEESNWTLADSMLMAMTCVYKGASEGAPRVGEYVLDADHPVLAYARSLLTEHHLHTTIEMLTLSAEDGLAEQTRTYQISDHVQLTLQHSAFLLMEEVLLHHAHCLNAQVLQDSVANMVHFLGCPVPQLAARAAWLLYAVFTGVVSTGELSWWVDVEPMIPDLIERLLATADNNAYDLAFVRHACYEALGALFSEGDQQGYRTELKEHTLTLVDTFIRRINSLVQRRALSDVERLDNSNHICSILYAMVPLTLRLGKHSQRQLHDVIEVSTQLGALHNDDISLELLGVFCAMATGAEAVKDELATQLPNVFPIVMEALHKYSNHTLCNKAIKTISEFAHELEGDMGLHCSAVLQNVFRAMNSGQLNNTNLIECVTAIGDIALNVPKQFKRHCEESLVLLQENLFLVFQRLNDQPKHKRKMKALNADGDDLYEEAAEMVAAVFQSFSCVLQGLNTGEVMLTDEELRVVVSAVTECMQATHDSESGATYELCRALACTLADCLGLVTTRVESLEQTVAVSLLAPLVGAHPQFGHVLAADILQTANSRGVEPSVTGWIIQEVRKAEQYLPTELLNPAVWDTTVSQAGYIAGGYAFRRRF